MSYRETKLYSGSCERVWLLLHIGKDVMVKVFRCTDVPQTVLSAVLADGVAGISGGRTTVRNLLGRVAQLAESEGHEEIVALSTCNHPYAELAYIYDSERFSNEGARQEVVAAFNLVVTSWL